jgi:hypothetical protein
VIAEARQALHTRFAARHVESRGPRYGVRWHELTTLARLLSTQLPGAYVEFLRGLSEARSPVRFLRHAPGVVRLPGMIHGATDPARGHFCGESRFTGPRFPVSDGNSGN